MNLYLERLFTSSRNITKLMLLGLLMWSFNSQAGIFDEGDPEQGKAIFNANCAACHAITAEVVAAPGLEGIAERWGSTDEMLVKWIQNPQGANETGDPYVKSIVERYVGTYGWMTAQAVNKEEIQHIMAYVREGAPEEANGGGADCPTIDDLAQEESNTSTAVWFLILLSFFLVMALASAGVRRTLSNAVREKEGSSLLPKHTYFQILKEWIGNNVVFVSILGLFVTAYIVTISYQGAMEIGVYEGYRPAQPIAFDHSIHACENEVDCQYCHSSADNSKSAGIPSTNVCMNCHKGVKGGTDEAKAEIQKIYNAIGFDPETGQYIENYEQQPVKWVKVHNLPDHVYFNHSQHVAVGGLECQNCHGDVEKFTVGMISPVEETNKLSMDYTPFYELSKPTLTMGWCIECHNKAEIDMQSSEYYVEMHSRMVEDDRGNDMLRQYMEDGKVTVRELGGWECSKCHY